MYDIYEVVAEKDVSANPVAKLNKQELTDFVIKHFDNPNVVYFDIDEYGIAQYNGYLIMEEGWNPKRAVANKR